MSSDLPPGWEQKLSKSKNRMYYFNAATGESVWEKPIAKKKVKKEEVRASHILVKHNQSRKPSSWKEPNITRSKEEAMEIIKGYQSILKNKEKSFEDLASTESDCSSAKKKGDLGFFERGTMQKPFEDASFALDIGEISEIVDSDSGLHLILRTG